MSAFDSSGSGGRKKLNKNQVFKRQKVRNARMIRTEAVHVDNHRKASNQANDNNDLTESGGMLKVNDFFSSREFEITQLQLAMHKSKTASCTRVFQSLPRQLRRRTASHNIKRIPKRMRNRALREMLKSDQKVTVKKKFGRNRSSHGLTASQLYKARMSVKLLRLAGKSVSMKLALPQEVTASNCNLRSKMRALQKLIRESKTIRGQKQDGALRNNKMGSYDNTGMGKLAEIPKGRIKFYKRQRNFTWLPTHIWNAKRSHMIKRWGYQIPWSPTQKCFKMTHRIGGNVATSDGALSMDSSFYGTMIINDTTAENGGKVLKDIIHLLTSKRATLKKYRISQNWFQGMVYNIDQEDPEPLGPIDLLWVDAKSVLIKLHPALYSNVFNSLLEKFGSQVSIQDCRYSLGSITLKGAKSLSALSSILRTYKRCSSFDQFKLVANVTDPSTLPQRTMFAFECIDPRHLAAPRPIHSMASRSPTVEEIISLQEEYPAAEISNVLNKLCDPIERNNSYKNQQSLKELATRRQKLLIQSPTNENKNMIPHVSEEDPTIPVLIAKRQISSDWIVLLPWFWLLPVWYQLNRVSRVYHMGLRQIQQLNYESDRLYFPDDYPFTDVGNMENSIYKREVSKAKWDRKPPAKRVNFSKISAIHKEEIPAFSGEIGDFFSCDWKLLQILRNGLDFLAQKGEPLKLFEKEKTTQFTASGTRDIQVLNDVLETYKDMIGEDYEHNSVPITLVTDLNSALKQNEWEEPVQVSISEAQLPVVAISCILVEKGRPKDNARIYQIPKKDLEHWKRVKKGIYRSDGKIDREIQHPLPSISDLIGFITSGAFHLGEGRGVAHGFIDASIASKQSNKYVLIRNVGTNVYRLSEWTLIDV